MKMPIILYTLKEEINYYYPDILINKLFTILEYFGADNPVYKLIPNRINENKKMFSEKIFYTAQTIEKKGQSFTRVVFCIAPKNIKKIDFEKLWNISDDIAKENLFFDLDEFRIETSKIKDYKLKNNKELSKVKNVIEKSNIKIQKSEITSIQKELINKNSKNESIFLENKEDQDKFLGTVNKNEFKFYNVSGDVKNNLYKKGAIIFIIFFIALALLILKLSNRWIAPSMTIIKSRTPFLINNNSFAKLIKMESDMKCPYGTPVYDFRFNKVGVIEEESKNQATLMIYPEFQDDFYFYDQAILYKQPRRVFQVFKILISSVEGQEIKKRWNKAMTNLQPYFNEINSNIFEIIKKNYNLEEQEKIFKALSNKSFSNFIFMPIQNNVELLKKDLENYRWSELLEKEQINKIVNAVNEEYSIGDKMSDAFSFAKEYFANYLFKNSENALVASVKPVAKKRFNNILQNEKVTKTIKDSSYQILLEIMEDIELTKKGNFLKGKYVKNLKKEYFYDIDFIIKNLKSDGIDIGKKELLKLKKKIEENEKIKNICIKMEPKVREEFAEFLKYWIDQFFPKKTEQTTRIQILSNILIREILYGKKENIIFLLKKENKNKPENKVIELIKSENI